MKHNKMKTTCLLLLLALSSIAFGQETAPLSVDAFETKLQQTPTAQLVDVRTPSEFANGHLPNALNLDYRNATFEARVAKLDKAKPVFVYCLSGGRSAAAAQSLRAQGFVAVYDMQGGFAKWSGSNKPSEKSEGAIPQVTKAISRTEFDQMIAAEKPILIDFFAPWCAPCQKLLPVIETFKETYRNKMSIKTLNFDDNKALAQQLGVDEIPTLLIYAKGKLIWRCIGFMPAEMLQKAIDEQLASIK